MNKRFFSVVGPMKNASGIGTLTSLDDAKLEEREELEIECVSYKNTIPSWT